MPALIPELIALAGDPTVEISTLLRQAQRVAHRRQLAEFSRWIDAELQGYPDASLLPAYRQRHGRLAIRRDGPTHLLPVANTERIQQWQTCLLLQPVSALAALAARGQPLWIPFPLSTDLT